MSDLNTASADAAREALKSVTGSSEGTADEAEAQELEEAGASAAPADGQGDVEPTEGEGASEAQEGTEDVPTTYFGVDLSHLEPEARKVIISEYTERDKTIQRLMQRNAALSQSKDEEPSTTEPVVVSDEDLLKAYGLDDNDPMFDVKAEIALPLLKAMQPLAQQVQELVSDREVDRAIDFWNASLDVLEKEYGTLPVSRETFIMDSLEQGILDPTVAFHSVAGPARKHIGDAAAAKAKAVQEVKRKQSGAVRPRTSAAEPKTTVEATNLHAAVAEAMKQSEQELGIDMTALSGQLWPDE